MSEGILIDQLHVDLVSSDKPLTEEDLRQLRIAFDPRKVQRFLRSMVPQGLLKKVEVEVSK